MTTSLQGRGAAAPSLRSVALLRQCRAIARDRMPTLIGDLVDRVAGELALSMAAEVAPTASATRDVGALVAERLRRMRSPLLAAFAERYDAVSALLSVPERVSNLQAEAQTRDDGPGTQTDRLKLVDDESLQKLLQREDLVRITQSALQHDNDRWAEVYWGMRLRVAHISHATDFSEDANPFRIRDVVDALIESIARFIPQSSERYPVIRAMRDSLGNALFECYREINEFLLKERVLPGIVNAVGYMASHGRQLSTHFSGLEQREAESAGTVHLLLQTLLRQEGNPMARQWASMLGNATNPAAIAQDAAFDASKGPRAGRIGAGPGMPGSVGLAGSMGSGAGLVGQQGEAFDTVLKAAMMDFLARAARGPKEDHQFVAQMLSEPKQYLFDSAMALPPTPELVKALDERQRQAIETGDAPAASFGYDEAVKSQAQPLDALTAEFVQSVFDLVLLEVGISAGARLEIARLQPAALKAAVIDRTFFARRDHPMRRLLDRLTQAARDPGIDSADGSEFVDELHDLVSSLNERFTDDLRVIDETVAEVDALVERHAGSADPEDVIDTRELERSERELVSNASASAELEQRIPSTAPPFIQDFLRRWWKRALVEAQVEEKTGEDSWDHRLETVEKLIWSSNPGHAEEISRLRAILPLLVRTLILGMRDAGMPETHRDAFLDALMNLHRRIISNWRAAAEAAAAAVAAAASAADVSPGQAVATGAVSDPLQTPADDTSSGAAAPGTALAPGEASSDRYGRAYCERLADSLAEGAVVEFISADVAGNAIWQPLRLSWVSPQRMIFLFTARLTRARQVPRDALVEGLETGTARLVEEGSSYLDRTIAAVAGT